VAGCAGSFASKHYLVPKWQVVLEAFLPSTTLSPSGRLCWKLFFQALPRGCNNNWRQIIHQAVTYSQLMDVIIIGDNYPLRSYSQLMDVIIMIGGKLSTKQ
jgi:hypothetical protein